MKNNLLFCLLSAAVLVTGCKNVDPVQDDLDLQQNDLIQLNGGLGSVSISRAETVRTEKGFIAGDLIGVTAIFSKKQATTTDATDEPNWGVEAENRHFTNIKATAVAPVAPEVQGSYTNKFEWADPQFYPQGRNIFLYAYYPYHDGTSPATDTGVTFIKNDGTVATHPDSVEVVLKSEAVTDMSKTLTQPDVMVASHSKATDPTTPTSIFRKSPEADTRLIFRHLLAQLQFSICKEAEVTNDAKIKSLTVYMPPKAKFPVGGDDAMTLGKIPTDVDGGAPDYTAFAKYTFIPSEGAAESIPVKSADEDPQFVFGVGETPFMTLPLSLEQLKANCKIELEIDLGDGYTAKTFEIKGDMFTAALKQGHVNTINFTINYVLVTLTASVSPWGTSGNSIDIPIE